MSKTRAPVCPNPKCLTRMKRLYERTEGIFIGAAWMCPECTMVLYDGDKRIEYDRSINHHVAYLETHGYDEIMKMSKTAHQKLHRDLRKAGKVTIPPVELQKISTSAMHRRQHTSRNIDRLPDAIGVHEDDGNNSGGFIS